MPQHFKLQNHSYWLWTDIDKILPTKLKFLFLFKYKSKIISYISSKSMYITK